MRSKQFLAGVAAWAVLVTWIAAGADWPRFRGPNGSGVSSETGLPETWKSTEQALQHDAPGNENIVWKRKLPGAGSSSPIVVGDKVFVTCYGGYALSADEPGDLAKLEHHLVCLAAADGKILWDQAEPAQQPEQEYRGFIGLHGYASGSPASDGQSVYVFYGHSGVSAYDLQGQRRWQADVGQKTHEWGSGTSPILTQNLVIVNASVESQSLVALEKGTGHEAWRATGIEKSWSTPVLVDLPGGKQELVVSMFGKAKGYDPQTGKQLWECATLDDYVCPAVVAGDGVAYISGGRKPMTMAIRAGGQGDVSASHVLWKITKAPKVPTPLFSAGRLYWVDNRGAALCVQADSGKVVYEERVEIAGGGDKVYASPVLADGKLYIVSRQGGTIVLAAGDDFKELARNDLGDKSIFNATPAVVPGRLLIRSDRFLYCIGK